MTESMAPNALTEPVAGSVDPKLVGIGGWLILWAVAFALGPIAGVVALVMALGLYSDVSAAGFGGVFALELMVLVGLLGFFIYAATLFFRKKRKAPKIIVNLLVLSLVASVLLLVIELLAGAEEFAIESARQLVRDVIAAAIWIPYFRVSKRVKATFVN